MVVRNGDPSPTSGVYTQNSQCHRPFFGHGVGPVAMEHAEVELLRCRKMPHAGHECLLERTIIGPFDEDSVYVRVMEFRLAMDVFRYGQAFPLHPRIEHLQDEVKDPIIVQFILWATLGHREVREDKFMELRGGKLDGNRRRCRLLCRCAPHARASFKEF